MEPPKSYKEVQKLKGCLAALNRFISRSREKNLPFFKNLRRMSQERFTWDEESNRAFAELKEYLGDEDRYHVIDKTAFTLIISLRKLKDYFESAPGPTPMQPAEGIADPHRFEWSLHVDGARNDKGAGAGVLITGPQGIIMEYALRFEFPTTNNEAEYEAMIIGLKLVKYLDITEVLVTGYSKLVRDQVQGKCLVKSDLLKIYHSKVVSLTQGFARIIFQHIPRQENKKVDRLSRLATTYYNELPKGVYVEICNRPGYEEVNVCSITIVGCEDWRTSIILYLQSQVLSADKYEARRSKIEVSSSRCIKGSYTGNHGIDRYFYVYPLIISLESLTEVHESWCGSHIGARSLAIKITRAGYYWPTLIKDALSYVKKCDSYQRLRKASKQPTCTLTPPIHVVTDQPLKRVLASPTLSRRLTNWAVELSEFELSDIPRISIKAQALADFVIECTARAPGPTPMQPTERIADPHRFEWSLHVDGARNDKGAGAGVLITGPQGITIDYALRFEFPTTNNEAEYEVMIVGLKLVKSLDITEVLVKGDSKLVIDQIQGYEEVNVCSISIVGCEDWRTSIILYLQSQRISKLCKYYM
ncbi:hypothetical protein LIER_32402 [Lithospermum erythrorhizon]|uniref:RNase H type-1 domain-containing protein n=1 Tax=Lithospermum erythrorhizon TaxID=34254 RepID=A0AAV3RVX8_LITER